PGWGGRGIFPLGKIFPPLFFFFFFLFFFDPPAPPPLRPTPHPRSRPSPHGQKQSMTKERKTMHDTESLVEPCPMKET
ncbi:MAG: hypothetical protein BJ554DRAFT_8192, partial [Olpidium bornovanus]